MLPSQTCPSPIFTPPHLAGVHILALDIGIMQQADVVLHTKVKQRTRLASSFVDDQLVEGVVVGQD
jgi:hypothetical protein